MGKPDETVDLAGLPDDEDHCYLVGIDGHHSAEMQQTLAERFDQIFEDANYVVLTGDLESDTGMVLGLLDAASEDAIDNLPIRKVHKDTLKEAVMDDG